MLVLCLYSLIKQTKSNFLFNKNNSLFLLFGYTVDLLPFLLDNPDFKLSGKGSVPVGLDKEGVTSIKRF